MNESEIIRYIKATFTGVDVVVASGSTFFFYDPDHTQSADHRFPFVTLVTNDDYDKFSNLSRPSAFRLNIGVSRETFCLLFSSREDVLAKGGNANAVHDFAVLDTMMPHPVYAKMNWVCVLNPGPATMETVKRLLAEAYDMAAGQGARN